MGCEPASAVVRVHRSDCLDCIRKSFLACLHPSGKNEEPLVVAAPRRRGQRGRGGNTSKTPLNFSCFSFFCRGFLPKITFPGKLFIIYILKVSYFFRQVRNFIFPLRGRREGG